jgi:hypothetical protein
VGTSIRQHKQEKQTKTKHAIAAPSSRKAELNPDLNCLNSTCTVPAMAATIIGVVDFLEGWG